MPTNTLTPQQQRRRARRQAGRNTPAPAPPTPTAPPAAPPANGGLDPNDFRNVSAEADAAIREFASGIPGGVDGEGGGGFQIFRGGWNGSASRGGGGGVNVPYPDDIASSQADLLKVDPAYQQRLTALDEEIRRSQGRLVDLDPETRADLEAATQASRLEADQAYGEGRDELLLRMFGSGAQRSTVAGEAGGRLLEGRARVNASIEADAAGRRLSTRQALTQQQLEAMGLRGQLTTGQLEAATNELGINVDQLERGRDRRADMRNTDVRANADVESASIHAGGQVSAATIGANSDRYRALIGLYGDQLRTREDARQFDLGNTNDINRLALDRLRSDRDYDIGRRQVSVQRYGIQQETSRFNQQLGFDRERYTGDDAFRREGLTEQQRQFGYNYLMDQQRLSLDWEALQRGQYSADRQRSDQNRNQWIAAAGTILAAFVSDMRLKQDIRPVQNSAEVVENVRAVTWRWRDAPGMENGGVLAQELEKVAPQAVFTDKDGTKLVDYGFLTAVLLTELKAVRKRVAELEAR